MPERNFVFTIADVKKALAYYWQVSEESLTNAMNGKYSTNETPKAVTEGKKEGGD